MLAFSKARPKHDALQTAALVATAYRVEHTGVAFGPIRRLRAFLGEVVIEDGAPFLFFAKETYEEFDAVAVLTLLHVFHKSAISSATAHLVLLVDPSRVDAVALVVAVLRPRLRCECQCEYGCEHPRPTA
jgi:hypothetical protein